MPREGKGKKGNRKGNTNTTTKRGAQQQYEEEDEAASVTSDFTCSTLNSDGEEEEISESEKFELLIKQGIEMAQEKSQNTRLKGLLELKKALQARCAEYDELDNLHETICDIIERSLKRGTSVTEKITAAKLAALIMLVSINLDSAIADSVYTLLQPTLLIVAQDTTVSSAVREEVCRSVAVMAYFGAVEYKDLQESINTLHTVFAKALPKGNGELPTLQPATLLMHSAALQGFYLLLTVANRSDVVCRAPNLLTEMMSVLETKELEMRLEVGMGVALIYELVRDSADFKWRRKHELLDILSELATDSHKYRAKKERKTQRAIFRSIVTSIEDEDFDFETVTIATKKCKMVLEIADWATKYRYDCVCHVLEQGLNTHLTKNLVLRNHFDLPDVDHCDVVESRADKENRRRITGQIHKQRNLQRNKNRDNRAIAATYDD